MSIGDKFSYRCFQCEKTIIARQQAEGVKPMVFDCLSPRCRSLKRLEGIVNAMGKHPTHELVEQEHTTKLKLQKITEATDGAG